MRETGYRNTTYAIAELIDNAIQANAKNIELICYDRVDPTNGRRTIHQIAVVDDGDGMSEEVLEKSVQFGNGTRLKNRRGIGRFGMGLPNSSISQCRLAEVYTWQNDSVPNYSYVTVTKRDADNEFVPKPERKAVDKHWKQVSNCLKNPTGTLIVWSELDKCNWRKSTTIIEKSKLLIGRIYRNLIYRGDITIRVIAFNENSVKPELDYTIPVNDPCYLMEPSSTPKPYDSEAMFAQDGEIETVTHAIDGKNYDIKIKFSIAKRKARQDDKGGESGKTKWGKHAAQNIGVSLMRANRELELDTSLVNTYDTRERWWGVEVSFDPHLDEVFGVTNTKQSATNFSRMAKTLRAVKMSGEKIDDDELNEGDKVLWEIVTIITNRLRLIRDEIEHQLLNTRNLRRRRNTKGGAEELATDATGEIDGEPHNIDDGQKEKSSEQRKQSLVKILIKDGAMSSEDAQEVARYTIDNKLKYIIKSTTLQGKSLFDVLPHDGILIVKVNRKHHAYENLMSVVQYDPKEDATNEELQSRLQRASIGIELMLLAWARLEYTELNDEKRQDMEELRTRWGGILSGFLKLNT